MDRVWRPRRRVHDDELELTDITGHRRSTVGRLLAGRGRMIISHAPLTDDARRMARFHLRAALIFMLVFFSSHELLLMSYDRMLFRHHGAAEVDPANLVLALAVFGIVAAYYLLFWRERRPWYVMRRYLSGGMYARR